MAHRRSRIRWISFRAAAITAFVATAVALGMSPKPSGAVESPSIPVRRLKAAGDRFEGDFRSRLLAAPSSRRFTALVDLTEQLDLKALARRLRAGSLSKAARRAAVVASFETVASRQQA